MCDEARTAGCPALLLEAKLIELPKSRGNPATFAERSVHEIIVMTSSSDIP